YGQKCSHSCKFSYMRESLKIVNPFNLIVSLGYQSSLISLHCAI
ncbi:hypothetical protein A2U01_0066261, partial [Trifolium medium]|nr:hypothetical protein [Trifolium medium]